MSDTEEVQEQEQDQKVLTQSDVDKAITARLAREQAKFKSELESITSEKTELERKLQEKEAAGMTDSEHIAAMKKALEATQGELNEFKETLAKQKEHEFISKLDSADEKALIEAGFNPKYSSIVLEELKKNRGIESGAAFYKDGEGAAIEKDQVIETLKNQFPELVVINRAQGNNVPTGQPSPGVDPSKESAADYIERRNREREAQK